MGAKLSQSSSPQDFAEQADINVTPFIDVVLVLLIIFMVAAPLSTVDVPVDLPKSTVERSERPEKPVFITLKADLAIVIGEKTVTANQLGQAVVDATSGNKDQRLFLRADKAVAYGELMHLMDNLRAAGYLKVALVTQESSPHDQD